MLTGWQSALDAHAPQAATLRDLTVLLTAVCGLVWLAVVLVLARAALRRRSAKGLELEPEPRRERRIGWIVGSSVAATVLIITGLTVASFFATRNVASAGGDPLVIRVRGWQWWWEVTYQDARPGHVLTSANEIHVPVGRPVKLQLVGADVIHSFWAPSLAGKMDMIPGRDNELAFTAERPGVYRGQCAEFCGLQHAHMAVLVVAEPPEAFEAWRAAQLAEAEVESGEAEAGRRVFLSKPCAACHTVRGTPAAGTLGPDLTHVASRRTIGAGLLPTTPGSLAAWIADPQTLKPGNNMPMVPLSPEELRAVTAYMASLR